MEGLPSDHPDLNQSGQPSAALRAVRAPVRAPDSEGARAIAAVLVEGFDRHYRLFRATSAAAKEHFEAAAWIAAQTAVRERIQFYDERVAECIARVRAEFDLESVGLDTWKAAKLAYISLLVDHLQPELAETFYNSVVTGCSAAPTRTTS